MKKVLLNCLQLDANKLSNKEKKEITGGSEFLPIWPNNCDIVLCFCPHLGWTEERYMTKAQCNSYSTPNGRLCLQGENPNCPEEAIP